MRLDELAALAKTDPRARVELARTLNFMVRRYFMKRLGIPRLAAEDLTQSTLVLVLAKLDDFEPKSPGAFRAYVFRTAALEAKQSQRKWGHEVKRRVDVDVGAEWLGLRDAGPTMSSELSLREVLTLTWEIIAEFGSTTRRTIDGWMRGEDWRVLAEREGVKGPTLRSRVHRAVARLRERMRERAPDLMPESSST